MASIFFAADMMKEDVDYHACAYSADKKRSLVVE
jgi:hypothetical protein